MGSALYGQSSAVTIHGIGVPIQDTDPEQWVEQYPKIPYLTWNSRYGHRPHHIPMIWSKENLQSQYPSGRPLLLFNEPEYEGQANLTAEQALEHMLDFADYDGPLYGCGNAWFSDGWNWFNDFMDVAGSNINMLHGIHIHCYANDDNFHLYDDYAERWADLAHSYSWPVIISEYGLSNADDDDRDRFIRYLSALYDPEIMFIFSWKYHLIPSLDMIDSDGNLTDIGRWWFSRFKPSDQIFLPAIRA
jgi:hypothetical protein